MVQLNIHVSRLWEYSVNAGVNSHEAVGIDNLSAALVVFPDVSKLEDP
jgi:hypothetical protein